MQIVRPSPTVYSLASRRTMSSASTLETSEVSSNISRPKAVASIASTRSRYSTTALSRSVVVGELRITVSDSTAPSSMVAVGGLGSMPFWRKRSSTSVAVEPTGSKVAVTGTFVSIEPMWWWSRISTISACSTPGDALRLLGVVDEQDAARLGVGELGVGDEPDRLPARRRRRSPRGSPSR